MRRNPIVLITPAILLLLFLQACAIMQAATPPTPKNPTQGIILANYETAAVVNAATDSYEQGLIDAAALRKVLNGAEEAQTALATARSALEIGDIDTASGQLQATRALLQTMRNLLGGDA